MDISDERTEELFCDALEIESIEERQAFVVRACAGDVALQDAVEQMLLSYSGGAQFFEYDPADFIFS